MNTPLTTIRALWAGFFVALVVCVAVLPAVVGDGGDGPAGIAAIVVAAQGMFTLVAPRLIPLGLDCTDDATLVASYRRSFLIRLAISASPLLLGFGAAIWAGASWVVLAGVPFTLAGYARIAPIEPVLARQQAALDAAGCGRDLRRALGAT